VGVTASSAGITLSTAAERLTPVGATPTKHGAYVITLGPDTEPMKVLLGLRKPKKSATGFWVGSRKYSNLGSPVRSNLDLSSRKAPLPLLSTSHLTGSMQKQRCMGHRRMLGLGDGSATCRPLRAAERTVVEKAVDAGVVGVLASVGTRVVNRTNRLEALPGGNLRRGTRAADARGDYMCAEVVSTASAWHGLLPEGPPPVPESCRRPSSLTFISTLS